MFSLYNYKNLFNLLETQDVLNILDETTLFKLKSVLSDIPSGALMNINSIKYLSNTNVLIHWSNFSTKEYLNIYIQPSGLYIFRSFVSKEKFFEYNEDCKTYFMKNYSKMY